MVILVVDDWGRCFKVEVEERVEFGVVAEMLDATDETRLRSTKEEIVSLWSVQSRGELTFLV